MRRFKDIHTHNPEAGEDSIINLQLGAPVPDHGFYSVGIHPWDTINTTDDDILALSEAASRPNVVAIGECGLDALQGAPLPRQEQIFREHVRISEELKKPLIIHAVRTLSDIMRLRKELKPTQQWIIHGFRGKPQIAKQLLSHGIDISLGKVYNPEVPVVVPPDRLYHETD